MSDITLTRIPGYDCNGNPRHVVHYLNFLTPKEIGNPELAFEWYKIAIRRAHSIGGRRYRAKWFGGGIVFTDYENVIRAAIRDLMQRAEKEQEG